MVSITLVRTLLFVPANRPERFAKAAAYGADAVILDLEDAVPAEAKDAARAALTCNFTGQPVIVRINAQGTPWHGDDLAAVRDLPVAAVMLPKAEANEALGGICNTLKAHAPVIALVETARGIADARAIATVPGVERLAFGSVDYCADLGCAHLHKVLLSAQVELVLASRLAGIAAPIDGVTTVLDNPAITASDAAHARDLGFTGKLCIHPKQIAEVQRAFAPSEADILWARKVLASGDGAASVDGAMVDEPIRIRARSILAQVTN